ncbi:hypothetical protein DRO58_04270 [Candidatus Bathyarchaeota archaeon]|nr:MAG: hypothetical protein DRO58_04270 [Candidatus Bathyarchaeota archaeon]
MENVKKIMPLFGSIALVLIAGMFATAGTLTYFSDTEKVSVGDIKAGTLNLKVGVNEPCTAHITIRNIAPGWSGDYIITITNTGTLTGKLSVEFSTITNLENTCEEPEEAEGDDPASSVGELGEYLGVAPYIYIPVGAWPPDVCSFAFPDGKSPANHPLNTLGGQTYTMDATGYGTGWETLNVLGPGDSRTFVLNFYLPEGTSNVVQSDSVEFDIIFHLDQVYPPLDESVDTSTH